MVLKIALLSWWVYSVVGRSVPKCPGSLFSHSSPLISDTVYTGCGATQQIPNIKLMPCSIYNALTIFFMICNGFLTTSSMAFLFLFTNRFISHSKLRPLAVLYFIFLWIPPPPPPPQHYPSVMMGPLIFYVFLLSLFTRITSALFIYDKRTLLNIGHRCTNLLQDTLSTDPAWPLEILRNTEVNKGHLNNHRRRKKHRGRRAGIRNRLRKRAHSPLPSILLANVQSLDNKMDNLRARISFQRDIRDCNILCLTETWLTPSVPDMAVRPSDNFSVLRMDRTAQAGKKQRWWSVFHD